MPRNNERYTVEQMAEALHKAGGIMSWAAEALGCRPETVRIYLDRYPELEKVREQAREVTLDIAEQQLISKIKSGNLTAAIFYLKCQGKQRGYIERGELAITSTKPVVLLLPQEEDAAASQLAARGNGDDAHVIETTVAPALPAADAPQVDETASDESA